MPLSRQVGGLVTISYFVWKSSLQRVSQGYQNTWHMRFSINISAFVATSLNDGVPEHSDPVEIANPVAAKQGNSS